MGTRNLYNNPTTLSFTAIHLFCRPNRHASYRAFTYMIHGVLGKGVRKVIPACSTTRIRQEFPEASGVYVGFRQGNDGEVLEVPEQFGI